MSRSTTSCAFQRQDRRRNPPVSRAVGVSSDSRQRALPMTHRRVRPQSAAIGVDSLAPAPATAMVRLEFTIDLDYDVASPADFVFLVAAAETPAQRRRQRAARRQPAGGDALVHRPALRQRGCCACTPAPGPLHVAYAASVDIRHAFADPHAVAESAIIDIPADVLPFLAASRYCQSDRLVAFAHARIRQRRAGLCARRRDRALGPRPRALPDRAHRPPRRRRSIR